MSTPAVTRTDFQQLADVRLSEAKALLDLGMWDGAYYLTGYALEVALKACIIKVVMARDAFLEKKFSEKCYTHDLDELMKLAELKVVRDAATAANPTLSTYWGVASDWSEQTRYHRMTEAEARRLYNAVSDPANGVLQWIRANS